MSIIKSDAFEEQRERNNIRQVPHNPNRLVINARIPIMGDVEVRISEWCPYKMIVAHSFIDNVREEQLSIPSPWGTSLRSYDANDIIDVLLEFDVLTSITNKRLKELGCSTITKKDIKDYTLKRVEGLVTLEHKNMTSIEFRGTAIRYYNDYEYESHQRISVFDRFWMRQEIVQLDECPIDEWEPTLESLSLLENYCIDTLCRTMPYAHFRVQAWRGR